MILCRYLLHLPGQAYSARLKYLLLCNATVIFPPDGNNEFYYHMLQARKCSSCRFPSFICICSLRMQIIKVKAFARGVLQAEGSGSLALDDHSYSLLMWLCTDLAFFLQQATGLRATGYIQDNVNVVMPEALTWDGGGKGILAALRSLQKDPARAEQIAAAGYDLAQSVLRPENVRRCRSAPCSTYIVRPLVSGLGFQILQSSFKNSNY